MRYLFTLMSVVGLILFAVSCSDDELLVPVQIEIRPDTIRMDAGADTATFAVMINSKYDNVRIVWSAKSDTSWLSCSPMYNYGSRFVDVMVLPNEGEKRVGTITVNPRNSEIYLKVIVIQSAHDE